jgi:hypothetical protein
MPERIYLVRAVVSPSFHVRTQRCVYVDIANYIYEHPGVLELNLQGIWIADRKCLSVLVRGVMLSTTLFQRLCRGMLSKNKSLRWILYTNTNMSFHLSKFLNCVFYLAMT